MYVFKYKATVNSFFHICQQYAYCVKGEIIFKF